MNRRLLFVNAGLMILLVALTIRGAAKLSAIEIGVTGDAVTLGTRQVALKTFSENGRLRLLLDFGTEMVEAARVGEIALGPPITLEPAALVVCRWETTSRLMVVPVHGLRGATRYTIHFDPSVETLDGRRIAGEAKLTFDTERLRLLGAYVAHAEPGHQVFVLRFSRAVNSEAIARAMTLTGPSGADLRFRVEPISTWRTDRHAYRVTLHGKNPGSAFPRWVEVRLAGRLTPDEGHLPLGRTVTERVDFVQPIVIRGVTANAGHIDIELNRRIDLPDKGTLALEPPIPYQVVTTWSGLRLLGEFSPGGSLAVILKAGFPGRGPHRLAVRSRLSVRVRDLEPSLAFAHAGQVLSSRAIPDLLVKGVNVEGFRITARTAYPNNAIWVAEKARRIRRGFSDHDNLFGPPRSLEVAIKARRNERFRKSVDLRRLLGDNPRGFHLIEIRDRERGWRSARELVQVTDLGVTVRAAPDAIAVRVQGLASGRAVAGARVCALTPTNQELASGTTDADGVAVLRYRVTAEDRVPYLVMVEKDADATYVDLKRFAVELTDDTLGGRPYVVAGGLEAFVAFDRGVVRPGGEARATIVVRDAAGTAPAAAALEARWYAPDGRPRHTARIAVPGSGLAVARFLTDRASPTGAWRLEVGDPRTGRTLGKRAFQVEAFVPDRLEAEVKLDAPLRLGAPGHARIVGRWLEGSPAAGRPAKVHVRFDRYSFKPRGFEGYSFGTTRPADPPGGRPPVRTALDAEGKARVRFGLPGMKEGAQALEARLVVEVADPSGRSVRAGLRAPVLRPDYLLGIKAGTDGARIALVTPEGEPYRRPVTVEAELQRRVWTWRRVPTRHGGYRYDCRVRSRTIDRGRVETATGRARIVFNDLEKPGSGWLVAVVRAGGAVAEQSLGQVPAEPDRLRVAGPPRRVRPGEEARLVVSAPFAGTAFITLEGTTIHATHTVPIERGDTPVRVPVPAGLTLPNLHAVVTLTTAQIGAGDGPVWIAGGVSIPLAHPRRATAVSMEAPSEVHPGSRVKIRLHAPDAAEAVVALVDEGILRLTEHPTPDPLAWFLANRRLDSTGADTGQALLEGARFAPPARPGGGGGDSLLGPRLENTTSQFIQPVALFEGPVRLDREGRGECAFVLPPDYEGRLRVMAVAAGSRAVGGTAASIRVRAPLGLRVAAPRVLAPGDESTLSVTLRNSTGRDGTVAIRLRSIDGLEVRAGLRTNGDTITGRPLVVPLADGETRTVDVRAHAGPRAGAQGLEVVASLGRFTRSITRRLVVRPVTRFVTERRGFVAAKATQAIPVPGRWLDRKARARIVATTAPDEQLRPVLEALIEYPYGCVEQTTSRCFALLAAGALGERLGKAANGRDLRSCLDVGVARLFCMQTPSGGLAMWPGGDREYAFGGIYALDFLLSARASGVPVPAAPLQRLVDRVACRLPDYRTDSHRAYAASVLARAGRPVASWLERLAERTRGREDRARIALGLAHLGRSREALAVMNDPTLERQTTRETGGLLRSGHREDALVLRALLAAAPADPRIAELVPSLSRVAASPERLNTQEQAQVLLALARFFDAHAPAGAAIRARVKHGGRVHRITGEAPLELEVDEGSVLLVENDGPTVYGLLVVSGHRLDVQEDRMDGLRLERGIVDVDTGKTVKGQTFRKGGVYEVRLRGVAARSVENLLVTDIVPGGFEIENPWLGALRAARSRGPGPDHLEMRDDRVLFFSTRPIRSKFEYTYRMRAVFPGAYRRQPFAAEALYEPGIRTQGGGEGKVVVE